MQTYGCTRNPNGQALYVQAAGGCPRQAAMQKNATEKARRIAGRDKTALEALKAQQITKTAQRRACCVPTRRWNTKTGVGMKRWKQSVELERLL